MTQEEVFKQINAAAQAEGHDVEQVAREAAGRGQAVATADALDVGALLDQFKPRPTFSVVLPTGQTIECEPFRRVKDRQEWKKRALGWFKHLPLRGSAGAANHPLKDVLPADGEEAMYAHLLHTVSVKPKVSLEAALALNEAPDLMLSIQQQIDEGNQACYIHAMNKVIELQGKDLSGTSDIE